jgi:hypothetical protein
VRVLRRERERGVCVGCDDSVFIIHILEAITLYHHLSVHSFFVFSKGNPPSRGVCKKKLFVTVTAFVDTIITNTNGSTTTTPLRCFLLASSVL